MRYNLIDGSTSQDYDKLFELVDKGYDIPILAYYQSAEMHDIAMARKTSIEIQFTARGIQYNSIFLDEYDDKEALKKHFIEMCVFSDVYFFDAPTKKGGI